MGELGLLVCGERAETAVTPSWRVPVAFSGSEKPVAERGLGGERCPGNRPPERPNKG